jgi:hypothetical protein
VVHQLLAQKTVEDVKRIVLGLAAVWVFLGLFGNLIGFTSLIGQSFRDSQSFLPHYRTLSVPEIESWVREQNLFGMVRDARTKTAVAVPAV